MVDLKGALWKEAADFLINIFFIEIKFVSHVNAQKQVVVYWDFPRVHLYCPRCSALPLFCNLKAYKEMDSDLISASNSVFAKALEDTWSLFLLAYTNTHTFPPQDSTEQSWYQEIILRPNGFQLTKTDRQTHTHPPPRGKSSLAICICIIRKGFKGFDGTTEQRSSFCIIRELILSFLDYLAKLPHHGVLFCTHSFIIFVSTSEFPHRKQGLRQKFMCR